MDFQISEYLKIFSNTGLAHYFDERESHFYIIFLTGLFFVCPAYLFFQTRGAIILSILLTLPILLITAYAAAWIRTSGSKWLISRYTIATLIICFVFYGSYIFFLREIDSYIHSDQASFKATSLILMMLFFGIPIAYFCNNFLFVANRAINSVSMDLQISHDFRNPVYIDTLKFINSNENVVAEYSHINGVGTSSEFIPNSTFSKLSIRDRILKRRVFFHDGSKAGHGPKSGTHKYQIPLNTDKFILSWYSYIEDKYYHDEFPFPYEKVESNTNYNLRRDRYIKTISDVTIHLWPGGIASIYQDSGSIVRRLEGHSSLENYIKVGTKDIDEPVQIKFIESILKRTNFDGEEKELQSELDQLKRDRFDQQLIDEVVFYDWGVLIYDLGDTDKSALSSIKNIGFVSHHDHGEGGAVGNYRGSLPQVIVFRRDRKEYGIFFDSTQLLSLIKKHTKPTAKSQGTSAVVFRIGHNKDDYKKTEIDLIVDGKTFDFEDWQIEVEYDWDK